MLIRSGWWKIIRSSSLSQLIFYYRNDILRKHGVIPEKPPSPTPIIEEAIQEAVKRAHENRLEGKDLDELDELEDEEDKAFLEKYRYINEPLVLNILLLMTIYLGSSALPNYRR